MAFPCLPQLSQLFLAFKSPPTPPQPLPHNTDLIHRASLPRAEPTSFPAAPHLSTSAFSLSLVSGAAHRAHARQQHDKMYRPKRPEPTNPDGTSWEPGVMGVDRWDVGYEKATQMFVKRKGRGAFKFEERMIEGIGKYGEEGEQELGDSLMWRGERREGREKLGEGFEYRGWVEEPSENAGVATDLDTAASTEGSEAGRRKGLDERSDSVRTSLYLSQTM